MHRSAVVVVALLAGAAPLAAAAHTQALTPNTASARRMTDALNILEAQGFGNFKDFHAVGQNFAAAVDQNGQQFTITVDPDNGQVTRQS